MGAAIPTPHSVILDGAKVESVTVEFKSIKQKDYPLAVNKAPQGVSKPKTVQVTGNKETWLRDAGIASSDWSYVDQIITKESGWGYWKWNSQGSGAFGLCQSLPASKMASAGSDYMTNPVTQLKWCDGYAKSRYQGWHNAWIKWQAQHWW